jgi:hypothetical protein
MAIATKTPSNHYEILEVAPGASNEEIARAFAQQMRVYRLRPDNPLVHVARLNAAYQTLCDPIKRKAYDDSIGLGAPAKPWKPDDATAIAPVQWLDRTGESLLTVPRESQEPPRREPSREMRFANFIADSLRPPPPEPEPAPEPLVGPGPAPAAHAPDEPQALEKADPFAALEQWESQSEQGSARRRYALLGGGVVALAILGVTLAVGNSQATRVVDNRRPASTVTVPLPPPAPTDEASAALATPPEPPVVQPSAGPEAKARPTEAPPAAAPAAEPRGDESTPASPAAQADVQPSASTAVDSGSASPADTAAGDSTPVAASGAKLPLPNATVARTIERIGYACGEVVSTSAAEGGAPGVFKVTCSSGDSYQATPLHGRYHFRRLGSR